MAKQKQQEPVKEEIQIPRIYNDNLLRYMEFTAKRWEDEGNQGMADEIRSQVKDRRKMKHKFMLENGLIEPVKPKAKKKKPRTYSGDTNPKLIEQAIEALTSPHDGELDGVNTFVQKRNGPTPTSVQLLKDYAKIWFEFNEDDAEIDAIVVEWEYFVCVPLYHFWGKKKRDKYLKEERQKRKDAPKKIDLPTPGWEDSIKIADFKTIEDDLVIIMPSNMDQTRLIKYLNRVITEFDKSYVTYNGSNYDEDQNAHACVFKTKEGYDYIWKTLVDWYS